MRLIAAFYPPCVEEVTTVDGLANEVPFRARRACELRQAGPSCIRASRASRKAKMINRWRTSHPVKAVRTSRLSSKAKPRRPNISPKTRCWARWRRQASWWTKAELREALKEKGLGTPATRASIIETLLKRRYIARQKRNLLATDLGRYLVAIVRDQQLKSPELTGEWEAKLNRIECRSAAPEAFMQEIVEYTRHIIQSSDRDRSRRRETRVLSEMWTARHSGKTRPRLLGLARRLPVSYCGRLTKTTIWTCISCASYYSIGVTREPLSLDDERKSC